MSNDINFDGSVAYQRQPEYLGHSFFGLTLMAAVFIHVSGLVIWSVIPKQEVIDVPVRSLSIKLGDNDVVAPQEAKQETLNSPTVEAAVSQVVQDPAVEQARTDSVVSSMEKAMAELYKDEPLKPAPEKPAAKTDSVKQYVREERPAANAAPAAKPSSVGSPLGNSTLKGADLVSRYEQTISLWIQKFKTYPSEARSKGMHGSTVVRIRIDRRGTIHYYTLEYSTGYQVLDKAVVDMIRRANPVPAVPADYPPGEMLEFLIPINFAIR